MDFIVKAPIYRTFLIICIQSLQQKNLDFNFPPPILIIIFTAKHTYTYFLNGLPNLKSKQFNLNIKNFSLVKLIWYCWEEKSNYNSSRGYQLHIMSPLTKLFIFNWIHSSKSWRLLLQIIKYSKIFLRAKALISF